MLFLKAVKNTHDGAHYVHNACHIFFFLSNLFIRLTTLENLVRPLTRLFVTTINRYSDQGVLGSSEASNKFHLDIF